MDDEDRPEEDDDEDCVSAGGWGAFLVADEARGDAATFVDAMARCMAATAAALAVEAWDETDCKALAELEADLAEAFGVQVWEVGKRCCGQNCCLHF